MFHDSPTTTRSRAIVVAARSVACACAAYVTAKHGIGVVVAMIVSLAFTVGVNWCIGKANESQGATDAMQACAGIAAGTIALSLDFPLLAAMVSAANVALAVVRKLAMLASPELFGEPPPREQRGAVVYVHRADGAVPWIASCADFGLHAGGATREDAVAWMAELMRRHLSDCEALGADPFAKSTTP